MRDVGNMHFTSKSRIILVYKAATCALSSITLTGGAGADAGGGLGGTCPPLDPGYTKKIVGPIPLQPLNFYSRWTVDQQLELSSFKKLP